MESSYDVVIIGAGTAGSVLANRLSAFPELSVLVLEAGEDHNTDPKVYTPRLAPTMLDDDTYDWRFATEAEPGLNNRIVKQPRGKMIGGSSAINSFALLYPNRAGIDVWGSMGNQGWNWQTLQPSFRKFQTLPEPSQETRDQLALVHKREAVLATRGPLRTSFPSSVLPMQKSWVETWRNLGLEYEGDAFEGDGVGGHTSVCHISSDRKERTHAGEAYLMPVASRRNLTITAQALVDKVFFSTHGDKRMATGVQYIKGGNTRHVSARRKVIIAAGALASPAILERSGIGNSQRLSALGIPLIYCNSGVGENLQDHIRAGLSFEAGEGVAKISSLSSKEEREMYEKDRSGPWSQSACWAFAYMPLLPLLDADEQAGWEEVLRKSSATEPPSSTFEKELSRYVCAILSSPQEAAATAFLSRKPAYTIESTEPDEVPDTAPTSWITLFAMLAHPLSRGSMHINSASPEERPEIHCNYYSNPLDLEAHARIIQGLMKVGATDPLKGFLKPGGRLAPHLTAESPIDDVKSYLRQHASTNYHPVGTCSMLPEKDGGVVDNRLRVYGTVNLHVVDASIMPVIPRCNVISTVYAVAEKVAEMLIQDLDLEAHGGSK